MIILLLGECDREIIEEFEDYAQDEMPKVQRVYAAAQPFWSCRIVGCMTPMDKNISKFYRVSMKPVYVM